MNPFSESLTRPSFIFWSLFEIGLFILILANLGEIRTYDLWVRLLIFILMCLFGLLIVARRLQNAGLNIFLSVIWILPIVGYIFWAMLFVLPTKQKA